MSPSTFFLVFASLYTLISPSSSQATSFLYKWRFEDATLQTQLPTCQPLPIVVSSFDTATNNTKGTPPYYMVAFAVGDVPTTTLIGTGDTGLSYTVDYPAGTQLLLSVTDAKGSPGGTYAIQTVVAGSSTSCVRVRSNTPPFTVASNVTSNLDTCQPWGLSITGGQSPYNISLVAANAPSVTNITLPAGDNIYTWINRAAPGGKILAAISDATGRWAFGVPLIETSGSDNTTCAGLQSSSSKGVVDPGSSASGTTNPPANNPTTSAGAGAIVTKTVDDPSATSKAPSGAGAVSVVDMRAGVVAAAAAALGGVLAMF